MRQGWAVLFRSEAAEAPLSEAGKREPRGNNATGNHGPKAISVKRGNRSKPTLHLFARIVAAAQVANRTPNLIAYHLISLV